MEIASYEENATSTHVKKEVRGSRKHTHRTTAACRKKKSS